VAQVQALLIGFCTDLKLEKLFQEMRDPVFIVGARDTLCGADGFLMGIRNRDTEATAFYHLGVCGHIPERDE